MKTASVDRQNRPLVRRRVAIGALLGLGAIASVFAACAKGTSIETAGSGGAGGGAQPSGADTSSSGEGGGGIGGPCVTSSDCPMGSTCTVVGNGTYCTQPCPPDCPNGTYCSIIKGKPVCIPDLDQECTQCKVATDCKMPTDECLKAPLGDTFCARDCTTMGICPNGFTCVDKGTYMGGAGGGAADGGVPDGGGMGDAGSGDAGKDGGGMDAGAPDGGPTKWCVPNSGYSCQCDAKRDGIVHDCHVKNNFGDCVGKEHCDGKSFTWVGCNASTPAQEVCNNKDENCNGMVDEGNADSLCMSVGPKPPHAHYACNSGMCSLGACDPGWAAYPPGPPSAGCACPIEAGEPNGSCASATSAGSVSDTGGMVTLTGTLSSANDVDFWSIQTVDTPEAGTNSYHVAIAFTTPMPNNEFLMDVVRGDPCVDSPSGPGTAITSYDWGVNGSAGSVGEAPCGGVNQAACSDHSANYYVRVYRKAGATGTCTQYAISVTAAAGASDLATQCM